MTKHNIRLDAEPALRIAEILPSTPSSFQFRLAISLGAYLSYTHIAECAVFGVADELKGEVPLGAVVLKAGVDGAAEVIVPELVQLILSTYILSVKAVPISQYSEEEIAC